MQQFNTPEDIKLNTYGIPRSRNYAAVDAVIRPDIALQISVSANHGFNIEGLEAVKAGLDLSATEPLHVVMVCPSDVVDAVHWQPLMRGKKRVQRPQSLIDGKGLCQYRLAFDWK